MSVLPRKLDQSNTLVSLDTSRQDVWLLLLLSPTFDSSTKYDGVQLHKAMVMLYFNMVCNRIVV